MTIESDAITEITMSGPGAGGPQTASAVLGDVISAMIPPASTPETTQRAGDRRGRRVGVLPAPRGRRPARACSPRSPRSSACRARRSSRSSRRAWARTRAWSWSLHPLLESRFFAALRADRPARLHALAAARDPRDRGGVRLSRVGPDRALPRPAAVRGRTTRSSRSARARRRWCRAPRLSERVGAEVWLKLEGANPTGSFKDRGMTCAVSAARARGRRGGHLRVDRQHRGERRRLRGARRADAAR